MKIRHFLNVLLATGSILAGSQAQAQASSSGAADPASDRSAKDDATIVVTGSRIPRANLDTGQPIVVVDDQIIEQRGYNTIADALQDLPAFGVPGSSRAGQQSGAFGSGQNFINFLGLGDQRTLVVVNGRRFVSSNTASIFGPTGAGVQVDLNVIPTLLVDRVETIAVGGAPIYGSDAIAGTVNVLTKQKYEGIKLDTQYGLTEQGDADDFRIRGLAGFSFGDGRGNITVAGEYNRQGGLTNFERADRRVFSSFTTARPGSAHDNMYLPNRRLPSLSQYGLPVVTDFITLSPTQAANFGFQPAVTDAAGRPLGFDVTGNLVPIDFGTATGNLLNFEGGSGFALPANLLTPVRRYLATMLADYELTDEIRLFGEAWYANSRGEQLRSQPVYNTALFGPAGSPDGNLIVKLDNPFLSTAARNTIAAALASNPASDALDQFYLTRANTDLFSGAGASTVEMYRFVGGIESSFELFGRKMNAQIVANYGRSTTQGRQRELVQQNFENALNAVRNSASNIVCAPGAVNSPVPTLSSTCAPINPFGQQISQAAQDYVTAIADPRAQNTQWLITASISGELFDLWGGGAGFAVGYEHRDEQARFDPGLFYRGKLEADGSRTAFGRSVPIDPVAGGFNTDEVFGELRLPIIGPDQRLPLIRRLEVHGAARYIQNSLAGGDWTYSVDGRWEPLQGLALRANYTRSVRAPAVTELFNPTSQIFTTATDPCDQRFLNGGPNPATRKANCAAAGLPVNFSSDIVDFTSRGTLSGNPRLENEIASARTLGLVLRPEFLAGFSATVDWIDIRVTQAILSLDATQILEGCYDSPSYPNTLCSRFTRTPAGQVTFISTGYANAAETNFQGILAQIAYQAETPFLGAGSAVDLTANYQYIDRLDTRGGLGDLSTSRNSIGYSPHKMTVNATYSNQGFSGMLQWIYFSSTRIDPDQPLKAYQYPVVPAVSFFNGAVSYRLNKKMSVRFNVDNIFDTLPPFPSPAGGGTIVYNDGLIGRSFRIGVQLDF